ncbi:hypothetical protein VTO42DRAFT_5656 [Malbranchea cinnamomea]
MLNRFIDRSAMLKSKRRARGQAFLEKFVQIALFVLTSDQWQAAVSNNSAPCDLADLIDGRLFFYLLNDHRANYGSDKSVLTKFDALASVVKRFCNLSLSEDINSRDLSLSSSVGQYLAFDEKGAFFRENKNSKRERRRDGSDVSSTVLPFSNIVFDAHLAPVRLSVDQRALDVKENTSKIFLELSHWHNHLSPLLGPQTQSGLYGGNARMLGKFDERNGRSTRTRDCVCEVGERQEAEGKVRVNECTICVLKGKEKGAPAKYGKKEAKPSVREAASVAIEKKRNEAINKQILAWVDVKVDFEKEPDLWKRHRKVTKHLASLPKDKRNMVKAEILAYSLNILVELWLMKCKAGQRDKVLHIAAFIWEKARHIAKLKSGVTPDIVACVTKTVEALRLPALEFHVDPHRKSKLSFQFAAVESARAKVDVGLSPTEFQLLHAGPFFDRDMGSAPDHRVPNFEPDKWQREVLDEIDANNSLFVVAPTSAGKTFISFYAMKKVLEEDDDGVLVYVAPTKTLVNQIAAEIQARFSKNFKHGGGKSVWSIHTRDYRINNPTGCQVLVTVPHILQIMLLAPNNANGWSCRVKRIIFDEIHCISQAEDGVIWEQLLLLAPCPIIALSATVGNLESFSRWLSLTQRANNIDLKVNEHRHRYSDLRKYVYYPPQKFHFNSLPEPVQFPQLGLDGTPGLAFIHPVASLIDRSRGMPDDLSLEARDCWLLWKAMSKHQTEKFPVEKSLDPTVSFPKIIRKVDVINWEAKLKALLKVWLEDHNSPFEKVVEELEQPVRNTSRPELLVSSGKTMSPQGVAHIVEDHYLHTTLPLICSLYQQGALPALSSITTVLGKKAAVDTKKNHKKGDHDMSKEERLQEAASIETNLFETFDPESPVEGFHFADVKKVLPSDFERYANELRKREVPEFLIRGLRRGIGVHHSGLNRRYHQLCEMLFRKGYLRVVIATGTLALELSISDRQPVELVAVASTIWEW